MEGIVLDAQKYLPVPAQLKRQGGTTGRDRGIGPASAECRTHQQNHPRRPKTPNCMRACFLAGAPDPHTRAWRIAIQFESYVHVFFFF